MVGRTTWTTGTLTAALTFVGAVSAAVAQRPRPADIWAGVYNGAQAERGKTAFTNSCAECHKPDLSGDKGPALKGESFIKNWEAESLNQLFGKIRDSMPANGPETVTDSVKLDVVAYILQANGFPAGRTELPSDPEQLDAIEVKRQVVNEVPNFSTVQIVGCLAHGPQNTWTLMKASAPVATKEERPTPQALQTARTATLGESSYLLLSTVPFKPEAHEGHKMEARGLLYRAPGDNRLDLLSLQMVDSRCSN